MSIWKNTGVMCLISVPDINRDDGLKQVDVGNFYEDADGNKMVLMTEDNAKKYADLVDVPVYTRRTK